MVFNNGNMSINSMTKTNTIPTSGHSHRQSNGNGSRPTTQPMNTAMLSLSQILNQNTTTNNKVTPVPSPFAPSPSPTNNNSNNLQSMNNVYALQSLLNKTTNTNNTNTNKNDINTFTQSLIAPKPNPFGPTNTNNNKKKQKQQKTVVNNGQNTVNNKDNSNNSSENTNTSTSTINNNTNKYTTKPLPPYSYGPVIAPSYQTYKEVELTDQFKDFRWIFQGINIHIITMK